MKNVLQSRTLAVCTAVLGLISFAAVPILAEMKTVTLSVPGMTCAACPITVKTALSKLEGVEKAEVSYEKKEAVVTYDNAKVSIERLKETTKNAGYPATEKR